MQGSVALPADRLTLRSMLHTSTSAQRLIPNPPSLSPALTLQGPVQAALNMLPEAAAYCRYTGVEGTAEVTVNNKLQALLSRGAAAEAHPGPEATGTEGEREGATGTGGDGEMGAGPGGSACLPLEVFLGALLGPHTDEASPWLLPSLPLRCATSCSCICDEEQCFKTCVPVVACAGELRSRELLVLNCGKRSQPQDPDFRKPRCIQLLV